MLHNKSSGGVADKCSALSQLTNISVMYQYFPLFGFVMVKYHMDYALCEKLNMRSISIPNLFST